MDGGRWPVAVLWGVAFGCLIGFIDVAAVGMYTVSTTGAWLAVGVFSYMYLRSPILGGICGAVAGDADLWPHPGFSACNTVQRDGNRGAPRARRMAGGATRGARTQD